MLTLFCASIIAILMLMAAGWCVMTALLAIGGPILRLVRRNTRSGPDPYAGPADPFKRRGE